MALTVIRAAERESGIVPRAACSMLKMMRVTPRVSL